MATSYQTNKLAEMKRLGWADAGRQNLPGPGRAPMEYIYVLTSTAGLRAFIYPSQTEYVVLQVQPIDNLKLAFEALTG
ncbi:hypothetical protein [Pseudomonas sp. UMAB-40]|uniref:hypothetical protein n=1 Tax=Pseudomonas sp. UMAB-40 TaxID=1365407 RepID=UPI001C5888BA|nr:hypothetical protein [Pseudomonas sp. UMAB-40]